MTYLNAFLFSGLICCLCQIVLDNTKFTPGHITSGLTVIGATLSFFDIYDNLIMKFGAGATVLISNFGHSLYKAGLIGYEQNGFLGIFSNLLTNSSISISSVIFLSFVFTLLFRPKN